MKSSPKLRTPDENHGLGFAQVLGILFLAAQLASICYARFIPEKFFAWAPYDQHSRYRIEVNLPSGSLAPRDVRRRYRYDDDGWETRNIANIISLVRQYERTYGAGDGARVRITYVTNGRTEQTWEWPES